MDILCVVSEDTLIFVKHVCHIIIIYMMLSYAVIPYQSHLSTCNNTACEASYFYQ